MKYVALLRGINVGGNHTVAMNKLISLFESLGYTNVTTYLNSGNVIFDSTTQPDQQSIESHLQKQFGFDIPTLIKSAKEMRDIAKSIPKEWVNDELHKTDVAYLFDAINKRDVLSELPFIAEYVDVRYTDGALYWNVKRENYNKSHLNKLVGHKFYRSITVRNINTARFLGNLLSHS